MNIQKINEITGKIITLQNKISELQEDIYSLNDHSIEYEQELSKEHHFNTLTTLDVKKLYNNMVRFEELGNADVKVGFGYVNDEDSWGYCVSTIYGDVCYNEQEIGIKKSIKLAEIFGIEQDIKVLKDELKGLLED